ncbi:cytochrome o ubiquinol oxidase subunit III [Candidatus Zinderia endosymbiont of Aphrophora alni]|uniref:cytochrome o ubiquinol oxidase subunit III n=1 Tax=Candidatus Zinderia endosymbiont of Aphrophora alni TaxID=3077951 RepID=UPI0030D29174
MFKIENKFKKNKKNINFKKNIFLNKLYNIKTQHSENDGTLLGFWLYIMSDCIIFACLFIAYAILKNNSHNIFNKHKLFNLKFVTCNTLILLTSSLTYGLSMIESNKNNIKNIIFWLKTTSILGILFLSLETYEIFKLIKIGAIPQKSAFLTSFFTIIIIHGIHIIFGIIWILTLIIQIKKFGIQKNKQRLTCLSMFWHFLDIIWINIFTFIYLIGTL